MIGYLYKCIENTTCFSKSQLWEHIKHYYIQLGESAWDRNVPYLVTNAKTTAKYHAHLILSHAKGPYTIIDYGAGIGQHGYYLAHYLEKLTPQYQKPLEWFTLYLADISPSTIENLSKHIQLQPFIHSRLVKPLLLTGNWLEDLNLPNTCQHCLIANYLFDSMPFLAFENNQLMGLSLHAQRRHLQSISLPNLVLKTRKLNQDSSQFEELKRRYQHLHRYTIPSMAIEFIQSFFKKSDDALMIINDKTFPHISEIDYDPLFNLTLEGCYSSTLNMDAIIHTLQLPHSITNHFPRLQTVVLGHNTPPSSDQPNCSDTAALFEHYKKQTNIFAAHCHSIAKSLSYDPFCLELFSQAITPDGTSISSILNLIQKCQANNFAKKSDFTLIHQGKILRRLQHYKQALAALEQYRSQHSAHPAYHLEMAILYLDWGKKEKAIFHLQSCLLDKKTQVQAKTLIEAHQLEEFPQKNEY
jgi:hypothetical protein